MEKTQLRLIADGLIIVFLCGVILRLARPVLFPLIMAVLLYYIFSPLLDLSSRIRMPRALALIILVAIAFTFLYLLGVFLYASGKELADQLPSYSDKFNSLLQWVQGKFQKMGFSYDRVSFLESLNLNRLAGFILSSLGTFLSFLTNLLLILVFLFFMLAGRGKLKTKVRSSFEAERALNITRVLDQIDREVQKYLVIKTVISLISAAILTIVLVVFGVNFALMFGIMAFFLNYIPSIGSIVAIALPSLVAAFQFGSILKAFWILLLLIATDFIVANVLEPRIMGRSLGLSPLVVLFSLFFWGWLWGIPGMILAVPILAVLKIVADHIPSLRFLSALLSR